jgi:hypothetical protein
MLSATLIAWLAVLIALEWSQTPHSSGHLPCNPRRRQMMGVMSRLGSSRLARALWGSIVTRARHVEIRALIVRHVEIRALIVT